MSWLMAPIRFFQRSFYRKLLISFFSIIIFTISVLVANFYTQTARDLKRQSMDNMDRLNQQSASALSSYLNNVQSYAWDLFGDPSFQVFVRNMGTDGDAAGYYRNKWGLFINNNPLVVSVIATQLGGFSTRSGSLSAELSESSRSLMMKYALEQDGRGSWIVTPGETGGTSRDGPLPVLSFVQAIKNISISSPGPMIGVMMFDLSPTALRDWLRQANGSGSDRSYILDARDGKVIISSGGDTSGDPSFPADRRSSASGHFYTGQGGGGSLVVYRKLPETEWLLVSEYSTQALLKPVNDLTKRTVMIGMLSLVLSMLLASLLASRTVTSLKILSKGMKAIETGNYEVSLPVRGRDEIGYISSLFNRMVREIDRLIKKVYEAEIRKKNAEIKSLQSQINPHFLYNTLGIIDSLSQTGGDSRVSTISRSLAKMLRYNLNGSNISTLEAEIQQIRLYLSIQKIRFDTRLDYSIYLEPGLEAVPIPKLLFQPLVENSVLHGISRSLTGGNIRVEAVRDGPGRVQITVWNNGVPIDGDRQAWLAELLARRRGRMEEEPASIGLQNVHSRARLLYGADCGISFYSSEESGTAFTITILSSMPSGGGDDEGHID